MTWLQQTPRSHGHHDGASTFLSTDAGAEKLLSLTSRASIAPQDSSSGEEDSSAWRPTRRSATKKEKIDEEAVGALMSLGEQFIVFGRSIQDIPVGMRRCVRPTEIRQLRGNRALAKSRAFPWKASCLHVGLAYDCYLSKIGATQTASSKSRRKRPPPDPSHAADKYRKAISKPGQSGRKRRCAGAQDLVVPVALRAAPAFEPDARRMNHTEATYRHEYKPPLDHTMGHTSIPHEMRHQPHPHVLPHPSPFSHGVVGMSSAVTAMPAMHDIKGLPGMQPTYSVQPLRSVASMEMPRTLHHVPQWPQGQAYADPEAYRSHALPYVGNQQCAQEGITSLRRSGPVPPTYGSSGPQLATLPPLIPSAHFGRQ